MPARREAGDPISQLGHEVAELGGGQRTIDPAVTLGEFGIEVLRAEQHLKGTAATHQPCEALDGAAAGNRPERRLELPEDRRLAGRKPHVAAERELAAGTPSTALDLGDAHEPADAEIAEHKRDRGLARQLSRSASLDPARAKCRGGSSAARRYRRTAHRRPDERRSSRIATIRPP